MIKDETIALSEEETSEFANEVDENQHVELSSVNNENKMPVEQDMSETFNDQSMNENHTIEGGGRPREDRSQEPELSVNDVAGLVIRKCVHYESDLKCDEEDILACAPVTWLEEPKVFGLDWKMLVIIAISVLIFFLLIVCIPLICCCIKK